jgi:hypothetical protein
MRNKKRKLNNHIRHCQWGIGNVLERNQKFYYKRKTYYFRKQIKVANRLLKKLK